MDTNVIEIPLTNGHSTIINKKDLEIIDKIKWHAHPAGLKIYAGSGYGKKFQSMHRLIMGNPGGMDVDHINNNSLDNRRENLRVCTHAENTRNRSLTMAKTSSKYKGVSLRNGRYRATICLNYKCYHLGWFETEQLAAQAYNNRSIELFGEFAKINDL